MAILLGIIGLVVILLLVAGYVRFAPGSPPMNRP